MHLLSMYILFSYCKVKGRLLIPTSRFSQCLCILFHFYNSFISCSHFHGASASCSHFRAASLSCSISMVPLHPLSFPRCLCILFPLSCCLCKLYLFPWCFRILFPFLWCCSPSSFSLLSTNGRETTRDPIPIQASWHIFPFHLSFLMYASRCNCKEQSLKRDRVGRINKTDDKNQRADLLYTMIAARKFSRLTSGYKHS